MTLDGVLSDEASRATAIPKWMNQSTYRASLFRMPAVAPRQCERTTRTAV